MTTVNTVLDAFVAPSALFERFEYNQRQSSIVLVILFGLILASYYLFFAGMTDEWLLAQQLGQVGDLSIQEREIAQEMMTKTLPYTWAFVGGMTIVGHLFTVLGLSAFFTLIAKVPSIGIGKFTFRDWFYFISWCQLPWIVNYVGFSFLFLSSSASDLPLSLMHYASLDQLFFNLSANDPAYGLYTTLNLFLVWSITISVLGLRKCFNMKPMMAIFISAFPYFAFFGIWFLFI
ncbi:YIP1 family protein [Shewanella woodyi]|uniref:YIP1 family protein n=1 Tax=Shewanella woodyi TaxID=60961 RepID=UPI0007F9694B|nr:YIP1 family protein [Shewanella woodyi]